MELGSDRTRQSLAQHPSHNYQNIMFAPTGPPQFHAEELQYTDTNFFSRRSPTQRTVINKNYLSYITVTHREIKMKLLVDTGSNKNYISPTKAELFVKKACNPLCVHDVNGIHYVTQFVSLSLFENGKSYLSYLYIPILMV